MTKSKNKTANVAKAANTKGFTVDAAKQKTSPVPAAATKATEVTPTQVAPAESKWKRKKIADSGVGASGGSITTAPQKPPMKKAKSCKGSAEGTQSSEDFTLEEVRHALLSEVESGDDRDRRGRNYHMIERDRRRLLKILQPLAHELKPTHQRAAKAA
ncbi:hypothetical protein SARC_07575 [Sphaeroforma arctica JP610]|uniref:Uncharacterized protein n=1 Tax=Sphaeroforma arctica JP610 TaxID=667725 RepID=A0A0L0FU53_9EUKA|nr:hypothetical protein SARC_07575 [Sphaeroforma arctica JP610]KNC80066.1 hypothetical protein SARC_07575 [Sphaeroforma arctica JP610]|eukprot:XP_014153968.1 hypothetical protein SARC_07575 [Sphaeroforma arctica JP610]